MGFWVLERIACIRYPGSLARLKEDFGSLEEMIILYY
jgi:hypothetical protein